MNTVYPQHPGYFYVPDNPSGNNFNGVVVNGNPNENPLTDNPEIVATVNKIHEWEKDDFELLKKIIDKIELSGEFLTDFSNYLVTDSNLGQLKTDWEAYRKARDKFTREFQETVDKKFWLTTTAEGKAYRGKYLLKGLNVDDLVHEPVKPDTNDFVFKYTENEKIERIRSSGKSNLAKFNEINKIIKDNGNVVENLSSASDVVAKFGLGLSALTLGWHTGELVNEFLDSSEENLFKRVQSVVNSEKYDDVVLDTFDLASGVAGYVSGTAAVTAVVAATGAPVLVAGLAVGGAFWLGTALVKTAYLASRHSDIDIWQTFVKQANPLDFSRGNYVSKSSDLMDIYVETVTYEESTLGLNDSADEVITIATILGSEDNHIIINNSINYVHMIGDSTDDTIANYTSDIITIQGGSGNDLIDNIHGENVQIYGGDGDDFITNVGNLALIEAGEGNNTINNFDSFNVSITSGQGNDYIENTGSLNLIKVGEGNNTVGNIGSAVSIISETGNDQISNIGDSVEVYSGYGDDYIVNRGGNFGLLNTSDGNDSIYNDEISNNVTVNAGNGEDYIDNLGNNNFIYCGENDDVINNIGNSNVIHLDSGDDYIENFGDSNFIYGNDGEDIIIDVGIANSIDGGNGNDYVVDFGSSNSINAGAGDDFIDVEGGYNNIIAYADGEGNDTIYGYNESDILNLTGGTIKNTLASGEDLIITFETNSLTFKNAANLHVTYVTNLDSANSIPMLKSDNVYTYTGGDRKIENYSPNEKVKLSSDFTGIGVEGNNFLIKSSSGALTLENVRDKLIDVAGADGNTAAYAYMASWSGDIPGNLLENVYEVIVGSEGGQNNIIAGNAGSSLISGGGNNTLTSGAGSDFMKGGSGQETFIYTGGNDVINNYESGEILNFSASYAGWTTEGNDLLINAVEGSVRIQEATNKLVEFAVDNNVIAHVYKAEGYEGALDGRGYGAFEVIVGSDNQSNQLYSNEVGSSLWGGRGNSNDELYGNTGADVFIYAYNNGQDNIFNAGLEDSVALLNISLDQIAGAQITDNGVTAQFTDGGSLNINGQAGSFKLGGQTFHADYQNKSWR